LRGYFCNTLHAFITMIACKWISISCINQKTKKIFSLLINTRNANSFTGDHGYKSMQSIAEITSQELNNKQKLLNSLYEIWLDAGEITVEFFWGVTWVIGPTDWLFS
jgi:hypothetical protein